MKSIGDEDEFQGDSRLRRCFVSHRLPETKADQDGAFVARASGIKRC